MPKMPEGARDGILKGLYRFQLDLEVERGRARSAVWQRRDSARSHQGGRGARGRLRRRRRCLERHQLFRALSRRTCLRALEHAASAATPRVPYVTQCLTDAPGVLVAASDYVKALPDSIDKWLPRPLNALGTDGFGRSENRASLREFFEVDHRYVVVATLAALARDGKVEPPSSSRRSRRSASTPRRRIRPSPSPQVHARRGPGWVALTLRPRSACGGGLRDRFQTPRAR